MPLPAHVQPLLHWRGSQVRGNSWKLARPGPHRPLPPLASRRLRSAVSRSRRCQIDFRVGAPLALPVRARFERQIKALAGGSDWWSCWRLTPKEFRHHSPGLPRERLPWENVPRRELFNLEKVVAYAGWQCVTQPLRGSYGFSNQYPG